MSTDELTAERLAMLRDADVEVEGRMPWSSNATFLVRIHHGDHSHRAIYKPVRGERPLWDFEPGLHRRERAAFLLSQHLGIGAVPPTIIRDGPLGEGSLQWFVEADHREHYFTIFESRADLHDQLRAIATLDLLANNTDRKSGHCLLEHDRVWAIDHGLCFAAPWKLRTVIWEFGGEPVPDELLAPVRSLAESVPLDLAAMLADDEVEALQHRAATLATLAELPIDETGARYPWPLV
ncbi:MAG: SCO1664 family protein [Ilumatobacteraceae bacterium]